MFLRHSDKYDLLMHSLNGIGRAVLGRLDRLQNRAMGLINDKRVIDDIPYLQIRKNVASLNLLYRYFHGRCSGELHDMVPSPLTCHVSLGD